MYGLRTSKPTCNVFPCKKGALQAGFNDMGFTDLFSYFDHIFDIRKISNVSPRVTEVFTKRNLLNEITSVPYEVQIARSIRVGNLMNSRNLGPSAKGEQHS